MASESSQDAPSQTNGAAVVCTRGPLSVAVSIGVPTHVEQSGTWINIDGQRGVLGAARQAPSQVRPLTRLLPELAALLRAQPAPR